MNPIYVDKKISKRYRPIDQYKGIQGHALIIAGAMVK
jgi:hypothetical protein